MINTGLQLNKSSKEVILTDSKDVITFTVSDAVIIFLYGIVHLT